MNAKEFFSLLQAGGAVLTLLSAEVTPTECLIKISRNCTRGDVP
jgi:hypothetical protein